jgi:endonuclease YncB( thermonuclease family)
MVKYIVPAKLIKTHDGDTATFAMEVFMDTVVTKRCRFAKINSPEIDTEAGKTALNYLRSKIRRDVILHVYGWDKYARPLVEVFVKGQAKSINQLMLEKGFANHASLPAQLCND